MNYYKQDINSILKQLDSQTNGLNWAEGNLRIEKYGYNELQIENKINVLKLFFSQFKSFIIYILLFAVVLSFAVQEYIDAVVILIILMINAFVGFFQELSAQKSLNALRSLSIVNAKVYRSEKLIEIDSKFLVVGDVIYLEAGDKVPADCRIIDYTRLKVEESALTGESLSVYKTSDVIKEDVQIGDQKNMLFSSTTILEGSAKAVVVGIGMNTEIGKITEMINENEEKPTPLQRRLDSFGKRLGYAVIAICLIILITFGVKEYMINGFSLVLLLEVFLIVVALAVAAVPEGLPAVVTITLSIGVKKLLKRNALVRKLSSVETLGSCNVICSDKTGTLTTNQMTVERIWTLDNSAQVDGVGYSPIGTISKKINPLLLEIGINCNNASHYKKDNMWQISGDPTEAALLVCAKKGDVQTHYKRYDELPFDSSRKRMSVLIKKEKEFYTYTKGAPDHILEICTHIIKNNKKIKLTPEIKKKIHKKIDDHSSEALRVLAFAYRESKNKRDFKEKDLIFVGLCAMTDPPRVDVIESIKRTKEAGIRVIMITGDYKETARAVGKEIGIEGNLLTGQELSNMSDAELNEALKNNTNIFARVIPEHKQRIVAQLQKQGHTVAMTGDGINDAPALDKADIGIAVGSGTDVTKEAADLVLLDDSFTNIVNAIEEGRGIYDNIQKSIMHLLSGNLSEILIIFIAVLLGWNLPLTAIMLLWINLITDGSPALALAVDPYSQNIMKRKPKPNDEGILPKDKLSLIAYLGTVSSIIGLILFKYYEGLGNLNLSQTVIFSFIVLSELVLVIIIRQQYEIKQFTNKWIWIALSGSILLQAIIIYTPLRNIFGLEAIGITGLFILLICVIMLYSSYIIYKILNSKFPNSQ